MATRFEGNADTRAFPGLPRIKTELLTGALIIVLSGGYIYNSFGGEIKTFLMDKKNEIKALLEKEDVVEESNVVRVNTASSDISVVIEEPEIEEEEVVVIYPEASSSELLDLGYEFLDFDSKISELRNYDGLTNPEEIKGWFSIDGTRVNSRITQKNIDIYNSSAEDIIDANNYYLHHDIYGNEGYGEAYIDSRINLALGDTSETIQYSPIILYGHHMRDGSMFSDIDRFQNPGYINEHQFGMFYTDSGAYKVEFFAGRILDPDQSGILSEESFYSQDLDNEDKFYEYVNTQINNSTFESDINPVYGDKLFVAITCNYTNGTNNSRYALFGRLVKQYTNEYDKNMANEEGITLSLRR